MFRINVREFPCMFVKYHRSYNTFRNPISMQLANVNSVLYGGHDGGEDMRMAVVWLTNESTWVPVSEGNQEG